MRISFLNPNLHGEFRINIGLGALITYIDKRTSNSVDLIDVTFYRRTWKKYVRQKIKKFNPDVIGVSALTFNFYDSLQIVKYIKKLKPNIKVIYGGIHPSILPKEIMKWKFIDIAVIGEGEYTLEKLLNYLENNKPLEEINGIFYKNKEKVYSTPLSEFIEDIDNLPFIDWKYFEIDKYEIVNPYEINMLGSRGCPFNCTYCLNTVLRNLCKGTYVRFRSPEKIIDEMKYQIKNLKSPNLRYFYFWDDLFNLKKDYVRKFCDLLVKSRINKHYSWSCSSRVDTIDEERIKMLSEANLNLTRIGIESGNYQIRKNVYLKNFTNKQAIQSMDLCKKYHIHTQTDFIIAGPKENEENVIDTFNFMRIIKPTQISLNIFQPYPMLKASEIFLEDGGEIDTEAWNKITSFFVDSPAKHNRIDKKTLHSLIFKMNIYYLVRVLFKHLKKQKFRFLYDIIKFMLYLKWKYNLLWHDLFKFTIRKYIYEENIDRVKIL